MLKPVLAPSSAAPQPIAGPSLRVGRTAEGRPGEILLPLDIVTATVAIVGQKGSGKTHFSNVVAEQMFVNRLPFAVIDPMGVFYGLRSSKDGHSPGFPILILGGEFGDVPLKPHMGRAVAEWIVEERQPVVLDLTDLGRQHTRFVADFSEELYLLNRGKQGLPLHLIVDEADIFAAQTPSGPEEKRCFHAIDEIVRRGRRRGLGITMITQRPAVIAKDVLTQANVYAFLRLVGPQDRKAVEDWLKHGDPWQSKQVLSSLNGLMTGRGWIWSPSWLRVLQKVHFADRQTFDSGATPKVGEAPHGDLVFADVDSSTIAAKLEACTEDESESDPKVLLAKIAYLTELCELHGISVAEKMPKSKKAAKVLEEKTRAVLEKGPSPKAPAKKPKRPRR